MRKHWCSNKHNGQMQLPLAAHSVVCAGCMAVCGVGAKKRQVIVYIEQPDVLGNRCSCIVLGDSVHV